MQLIASLLLILLFLKFSYTIPRNSLGSYIVEASADEMHPDLIFQSWNFTLDKRFDPSRVFQLSWRPRAFLYNGFLSHEECDHLISLAKGKLENASDTRTSTGESIHEGSQILLERGLDAIVARIEDRISVWTFLPKENGEPLLIQHHVDEKSKPNNVLYQDFSQPESSGARIATVILYLSDVIRGGETIFPHSEMEGKQTKDGSWSDCAMGVFGVKAVKGNALLLFNFHLNASADSRSIHGSCPVAMGENWFATKQIHARAFNLRKNLLTLPSLKGEECTDEDDNCPKWAQMGECERNPVFMLGTDDYYGTCRKSCKMC